MGEDKAKFQIRCNKNLAQILECLCRNITRRLWRMQRNILIHQSCQVESGNRFYGSIDRRGDN